MKILKRLFSLAALFIFLCGFAYAQEGSLTLYDEFNPDFKLERVYLSNKNVNIIGQAPDGRLLVRCTRDADPGTVGENPDYFWVSKSDDGRPKVEEGSGGFNTDYLQDIAALNKNTLYWTRKIQTQQYLNQKITGEESVDEVPIPSCFRMEINNPFIFHPRTSNYPLLLFSTRIGRKNSFDIYYSELKGSRWTCPQPITAKGINTEEYDEKYPFVTMDGTLFFGSDRIEGTGRKNKDGKFDLWAAVPTHKPFWENASVNPLPPPFNTWGNERVIAPLGIGFNTGFLVSDSAKGPLKLYFFKNTLDSIPPPPPRYYALVIGAIEYDHWSDLKCPVEESRQLAQILENDYGFQVTALENPDSSQFMEALGQYQKLEENEYLLVAYIGHGIRYVNQKNERGHSSQLVCRDAPECQNRAEDHTTCSKAIAQSINPDVFAKTLSLQAKHIIVILDACRSGYFLPTDTTPGCENKSRVVLSSTLGKEVGDCNHFFSGLKNALIVGPDLNDPEMDGYDLFEKIKEFMELNEDPDELQNKDKGVNEPQYQHFPGCNEGLHFPFPSKKR